MELEMYKVRISGLYKSGDKSIDFDTTVTMPECKEEMILSNVQNRVVSRTFKEAKYPFTRLVKCYVDDFKKEKGNPSYMGKKIKELDWDEIQDVAIAYDLRRVPLYRSVAIRDAREVLYREFCNSVKGTNYEIGFDYGNAADFVIEEKPSEVKVSKSSPKELDEVLDDEFKG